MSRIIRSTFTQISDEPVKEIQIRDMYIPSLDDLEEGEVEVAQSLQEAFAERERQLAEELATFEQERLELENQRQQQLQELEALRISWEEEKIILKQQAYDEGFAQGFEEGINKAKVEMRDSLEIANQVIVDANSNARKYLENQERVILDLSLISAERILGAVLAENEELYVSVVRRGLKEAREMKEIKIYVSPAFYSVVTKNRDELAEMFPTDVPFMIFVNEDLSSTESYIETNHGRIVVSIDEQLNELRLKLSEILESKE